MVSDFPQVSVITSCFIQRYVWGLSCNAEAFVLAPVCENVLIWGKKNPDDLLNHPVHKFTRAEEPVSRGKPLTCWEQCMWGVLQDPAYCPHGLLVTRGGPSSWAHGLRALCLGLCCLSDRESKIQLNWEIFESAVISCCPMVVFKVTVRLQLVCVTLRPASHDLALLYMEVQTDGYLPCRCVADCIFNEIQHFLTLYTRVGVFKVETGNMTSLFFSHKTLPYCLAFGNGMFSVRVNNLTSRKQTDYIQENFNTFRL